MRITLVARISSGLLLAALLPGCNGGGSSSSDDGGSSETAGPTTDTVTDPTTDPITDTVDPTGDDSTTDGSTSDDPTTADATTSGGPVAVARRVFVTAASFHGNLQAQGGGADGLAGADLLCASAAATASLGGTWVAWVSTSAVDALPRLPDDARWTLIDGTTDVFSSRSDIPLGPQHAIDMTEAGETLAPMGVEQPTVWTNTDALGRFSDDGQNDACDDWTGQTGIAAVGVIFDPEGGGGVGQHWTDTKQPRACGSKYHLYCFEI